MTGVTGKGKTRTVMEKFGYENVHRVIDYKHPFDDYKQQDVIIFEEFRNSLPIEQMLNFLDGYPVNLPCRYCNKVACYHKVFIITNWTLEEEYKNRIDKFFKYHDLVSLYFPSCQNATALAAATFRESTP